MFWDESGPSLDFKTTKIITFRGTNVIEARQDLDPDDLCTYINAFYRTLNSESLFSSIMTITSKDVKNLSRKKVRADITTDYTPRTTNKCEIAFDYSSQKEKCGFEKNFSCKYLACLVLSQTVNEDRIPCDLVEAKLFFKKYFKGEYLDVFMKCCEYHDIDHEEVLSAYKRSIQCNLPCCCNPQSVKKTLGTPDVLFATLLKITK